MRIFVVIPAYNESSRISEVLKGVSKYKLPTLVVDDGSNDDTADVALKSADYVLRHRINIGKGAALKTGCEEAFELGADVVIMMDSDGQHRSEDIPKFLELIKTGKYDVIFGVRKLKKKSPIIRKFGNRFASGLVNLLFGIVISDLLCGYRAFTKKAFEKINWQSSGYGVETEMVIRSGRLGLKYCELPVETIYYDKFKGVTILDAFGILFSVVKWRFS